MQYTVLLHITLHTCTCTSDYSIMKPRNLIGQMQVYDSCRNLNASSKFQWPGILSAWERVLCDITLWDLEYGTLWNLPALNLIMQQQILWYMYTVQSIHPHLHACIIIMNKLLCVAIHGGPCSKNWNYNISSYRYKVLHPTAVCGMQSFFPYL